MTKIYDELLADLKRQSRLCRERQELDMAQLLCKARAAISRMCEELEGHEKTNKEIYIKTNELHDLITKKYGSD